jgi:Calcineurin-like phosphoesterase
MHDPLRHSRINRREFVKVSTLVLTGLGTGTRAYAGQASGPEPAPLLRFGVLTDVHYADKDTRGTRHYRDSLSKMRQAVAELNRRDLAFAVELGDFIDAAGGSVETELDYLRTIDAAFADLTCDRHYVLGNHCIDILTKHEFLHHSGAREPHYSFDAAGVHFVILDACYRQSGEPYGRQNGHWQDTVIPLAELDWLRADLASGDTPTIVFAHQRLDATASHSVKNHAEVRAVLEESGRVAAVLQGHSHENDLVTVEGIPYCTIRALIEGAGEDNNSFGIASVFADGSLRIDGYLQQADYAWG